MSKTRFELLASAAQTATGQGGGVSVSGIKSLVIFADVTVVSASLNALYLQGSSDGGTSWFDLLAETYVQTTSGITGTSGTFARNIASSLTTGNIQKIVATYRIFPDYVRAAWNLSGSGPSSTFSVKGVGEN
jgi:hypothetical protein